MIEVTDILAQLVQPREQPVLRYSRQFYQLNEANIKLGAALRDVQYLAARSDAEQQAKLQEYSDLIAYVSRYLSDSPPNSTFYQFVWKQQRNLLSVRVELVSYQLQKLTAVRIADIPVFLQEQDASLEITGQSMQLAEKPAANMEHVNSILRDIHNTQKVTNAVIQMQGQNLWRIEAGVDQTTENVYGANERFRKALKSVEGYWKCLLLVFAVVFLYLLVKAIIRKM